MLTTSTAAITVARSTEGGSPHMSGIEHRGAQHERARGAPPQAEQRSSRPDGPGHDRHIESADGQQVGRARAFEGLVEFLVEVSPVAEESRVQQGLGVRARAQSCLAEMPDAAAAQAKAITGLPQPCFSTLRQPGRTDRVPSMPRRRDHVAWSSWPGFVAGEGRRPERIRMACAP